MTKKDSIPSTPSTHFHINNPKVTKKRAVKILADLKATGVSMTLDNIRSNHRHAFSSYAKLHPRHPYIAGLLRARKLAA